MTGNWWSGFIALVKCLCKQIFIVPICFHIEQWNDFICFYSSFDWWCMKICWTGKGYLNQVFEAPNFSTLKDSKKCHVPPFFNVIPEIVSPSFLTYSDARHVSLSYFSSSYNLSIPSLVFFSYPDSCRGQVGGEYEWGDFGGGGEILAWERPKHILRRLLETQRLLTSLEGKYRWDIVDRMWRLVDSFPV